MLPSGGFYVQNKLKLTYGHLLGKKIFFGSLTLAMLALPEIFS